MLVNSRGSHRGTLSLNVLYIAMAILFGFELATPTTDVGDSWPFQVVQTVLLVLYGLAMVPSGRSAADGEGVTIYTR